MLLARTFLIFYRYFCFQIPEMVHTRTYGKWLEPSLNSRHMIRVIVMSEHEAIYLKTINLSAQFITVQQECAKINSARNIVLEI